MRARDYYPYNARWAYAAMWHTGHTLLNMVGGSYILGYPGPALVCFTKPHSAITWWRSRWENPYSLTSTDHNVARSALGVVTVKGAASWVEPGPQLVGDIVGELYAYAFCPTEIIQGNCGVCKQWFPFSKLRFIEVTVPERGNFFSSPAVCDDCRSRFRGPECRYRETISVAGRG